MSAIFFLHGLDPVYDVEGTLTFSPLAHILLSLQPKKQQSDSSSDIGVATTA
jgi:hypothetical protein